MAESPDCIKCDTKSNVNSQSYIETLNVCMCVYVGGEGMHTCVQLWMHVCTRARGGQRTTSVIPQGAVRVVMNWSCTGLELGD